MVQTALSTQANETLDRFISRLEHARECAVATSARDQAESIKQQNRLDAQLIRWMLQRVLCIVEESPAQSVDDLRPIIRKQVMQYNFAGLGGDHVWDAAERDRTDQQVDLILRVIKYVRRKANRAQQWMNTPVTPLMCG